MFISEGCRLDFRFRRQGARKQSRIQAQTLAARFARPSDSARMVGTCVVGHNRLQPYPGHQNLFLDGLLGTSLIVAVVAGTTGRIVRTAPLSDDHSRNAS